MITLLFTATTTGRTDGAVVYIHTIRQFKTNWNKPNLENNKEYIVQIVRKGNDAGYRPGIRSVRKLLIDEFVAILSF